MRILATVFFLVVTGHFVESEPFICNVCIFGADGRFGVKQVFAIYSIAPEYALFTVVINERRHYIAPTSFLVLGSLMLILFIEHDIFLDLDDAVAAVIQSGSGPGKVEHKCIEPAIADT